MYIKCVYVYKMRVDDQKLRILLQWLKKSKTKQEINMHIHNNRRVSLGRGDIPPL